MEKNTNTKINTKKILCSIKTIALVGASLNPERPSNKVMKFLQNKGYKVIPVNPNTKGMIINNEICYSNICDINIKIDMVDVFRKSNECFKLAEETVKINAKVFWMQLGIFSKEAFDLVSKNNIQCVYDKCPKIEYEKHNDIK